MISDGGMNKLQIQTKITEMMSSMGFAHLSFQLQKIYDETNDLSDESLRQFPELSPTAIIQLKILINGGSTPPQAAPKGPPPPGFGLKTPEEDLN